MYSKLDICNRALRLIGEVMVSSLDEKTKAAEECKFLYPIVKRETIESYPWKCTRKEVLLRSLYNKNDVTDSEDYNYKFLLPFDCIRVLAVNKGNCFKRDGIYLYSNSSTIKLYYTADVDEKYLTLRLCKIISLKLALELTFSLFGDTALINRLNNLLNIENKKLTQLDSEEGELVNSSIHFNNTSSWLSARV